MVYKQRLTSPEVKNKFYTRKQNGGYNPCILGNTQYIKLPWPGCVLPNCTGYATGRFNEIIGDSTCHYLGNTNANNYVALAKAQGLTIGTEPKLGACICWDKAGACGHVAIVEDIIDNDTIVIGQSGWSASKSFWTATHKRGADGNWTEGTDQSWMKKDYKLLGFIYNPNVSDDARPVLAKGSHSIYVNELQLNLNEILGTKLDVDGWFGSGTEAAVIKFQQQAGLTKDGIVGPATQLAIAGALEDLRMPDGVFKLEFLLDNKKVSSWAMMADGANYIKLTDLEKLGIVKSVKWDSIKKIPVVEK